MRTDGGQNVDDSIEELMDAFDDCGLDAVLDDNANKHLSSLSQALYQEARTAEQDGSRDRCDVLRMLADPCSLMLQPENRGEPFRPMWEAGGRRSKSTDDFTGTEIAFFAKIADSIDHPQLRARLADLVWLRGRPRDIRFALAAIDSYMQIPLDPSTWFGNGSQNWRRAISLSLMMGKPSGDRLGQIESSIIRAITSATNEDGFFSHLLADTLESFGLGRTHLTVVGGKLESLADEFDATSDFHASGRFYNAAAKWFRLSGDDDKSVDMTVAEGEAFVKEGAARLSSDNPSHSVAASFLEKAVQVYRSVPKVQRDRNNVGQRIEELRLRINEYGKLALDEIARVGGPSIDVRESIEWARDAVHGKPVHEALEAFVNLHITSVKQLREDAIKSLSRSPVLASMPKVVSSHDGRVIAKTPGISGSTPTEEDEEEIRIQMSQLHYGTHVGVAVQALILPALDVVTLEHRLREADFIELARRSPIVPIGRHVLFGKALAHGFNRDFATSIHLLAPQIEHLVRVQLKFASVNTTLLDQDGIETEKGLSALIDLPETKCIFGEDLTYEIKTLFCDQLGLNFRNNIAHGLLDDRQSQSVESAYAWWLGLKLVLNTFWNSLSMDGRSEQQEQAPVNEDNPHQD